MKNTPMIQPLPTMIIPDWLACAGDEDQTSPIPLKKILRNSLYYPASGFDGDPIKYLTGNVYSFIYVDYGNTSGELDRQLENSGFAGYHRILSRSINEKELVPKGWEAPVLARQDGDPTRYRDSIKKPFAHWSVFQRNDELDSDHGAERFSLLYLCADGVVAY